VHLGLLRQPISNPERVVLIAGNDSGDLARAWEAGVNSVITDRDPLNTAVLAIMAALGGRVWAKAAKFPALLASKAVCASEAKNSTGGWRLVEPPQVGARRESQFRTANLPQVEGALSLPGGAGGTVC
jgi:hypothetical protein